MGEKDTPIAEQDPNDAAIAWAETIKQRVAEVESGAVELVPGAQLSTECQAILEAARRAQG